MASWASAASTIRTLGLGLGLAGGSAGCHFDEAGFDRGVDPGADATHAVPDAGPSALADAADRVDALGPPTCPDTYQPAMVNGRSRYRIRTTARSWTDAESECENDGAGIHLAVIDEAAELQALDSATNLTSMWIGVSDRKAGGTYLLVTGAPATFLPWKAGEPNDFGTGEDCVELQGAELNDEGCDEALPYLCECDGVPADPAAF